MARLLLALSASLWLVPPALGQGAGFTIDLTPRTGWRSGPSQPPMGPYGDAMETAPGWHGARPGYAPDPPRSKRKTSPVTPKAGMDRARRIYDGGGF